jgi:hypothetical protein
MVTSMIGNALWLAGPLLLLGVFAWSRRLRWAWAGVLSLLSVGIGINQGIVLPGELHLLGGYTDISDTCLSLLLWLLFGGLAHAAGGLRLKGPPLIVAPICGALMGELGGAAFLAAGAKDRGAAARLALAASAGGLVGRLGDPVLLLMSGHSSLLPYLLVPLAVLLAVVAGPKREDWSGPDAGIGPTVVAGALALSLLLLPAHSSVLLGLGCLAMAGIAGRDALGAPVRASLFWGICICVLTTIATVGGMPELLAWGMEDLQLNYADLAAPVLPLVGMLFAALVDGGSAGIIAHAVADRALDLRLENAFLALSAGAAIGSLGPLFVAGAVKEGLLRYGAMLLIGWLYIQLVLVILS